VQLVQVTLTPLQRRNRVAFAVTPSLSSSHPETGEQVVVRDQSGAYFGALVVASEYDADGRGTHQLRLGTALPEEIATRRLARTDFLAPAAEVLHEQIAEFLVEAAAFNAAFGDTVPHQR
jgi:hypothetical protein